MESCLTPKRRILLLVFILKKNTFENSGVRTNDTILKHTNCGTEFYDSSRPLLFIFTFDTLQHKFNSFHTPGNSHFLKEKEKKKQDTESADSFNTNRKNVNSKGTVCFPFRIFFIYCWFSLTVFNRKKKKKFEYG